MQAFRGAFNFSFHHFEGESLEVLEMLSNRMFLKDLLNKKSFPNAIIFYFNFCSCGDLTESRLWQNYIYLQFLPTSVN